MFKNRLESHDETPPFDIPPSSLSYARRKCEESALSTPNCINENENFVGDEYNIVEQFLER